jgi:hypothetical protein
MLSLEDNDVQYYDACTVLMSRNDLQLLATESLRVFVAGQTVWMGREMDKARSKILKNQRSRLARAVAFVTSSACVRKSETLEQAAQRYVEECNYWKLSLDRSLMIVPQQSLALMQCLDRVDAFSVDQRSYSDMVKMVSGVFHTN